MGPPAPFPNYSNIHPDHMRNEVPSYCGYKITGKFVRGAIKVRPVQSCLPMHANATVGYLHASLLNTFLQLHYV